MINLLDLVRGSGRHATIVLPTAMALVFLVAACSSGGDSSTTPETSRVRVVTTTAILADLARNVGGDVVEVRSIVPPGVDVHSFQPTPSDSVEVNNARLIVSNGGGLDDFLESMFRTARSANAIHLVAAEGLDTVPPKGVATLGEWEEQDDELYPLEEGPHFWQNPLYAVYYVERIRDALVSADPGNTQAYEANASAYIRALRDLDKHIAETLRSVPPSKRHLVTFHDAFGYFAKHYGWEVSAFVVSDATEVTPGAVVEVIEQIKTEGIPAIFAEPQFNHEFVEQAAKDAGVSIGIIYSDALDGQAPTYIDMMRFNANSLAQHLR